jgi:diguanylate cyclase (GGDEF)-like protein
MARGLNKMFGSMPQLHPQLHRESHQAAGHTSRRLIILTVAASAYCAAAPIGLQLAHVTSPLVRAFVLASLLLTIGFGAVVTDQGRVERQLRKLAMTDSRTGLMNVREFTSALSLEIARSSRTGRHFAVVLLDLDGLKGINDRWGHRAGDRAILRVANALRVSCRMTDTAARVGGDEFALILPEADGATALELVARMRALLLSHARTGIVTVSGGAAEYPRDGMTGEALLEAADAALYTEKERRAHASMASRA